jgi:hypothetical protein
MPDASRESTESHVTILEPPIWEPPGFEVISLACEISGYAPDDQPLF